MAKLPNINHKHKVCIICEGIEEHIYVKRLLELNVWSDAYEFKPINAKGESNIFPRFQDVYNKDYYEAIIIFCDTDKKPYKEYNKLKDNINDFFDKSDANGKIIVWANPCTMQIILSHFGEVTLKNQGKKTNADIIEQLTGVKNYDAHEEQVKEICRNIFKRTYSAMKDRIKTENADDTEAGTTNAAVFFDYFENAGTGWISDINQYLAE